MPKIPFWVFIIIALLYFTATRVDIMDLDATQYAEMSREVLKSGDYLHFFDRGMDYLDKPPFLFWVSAISMKIFGVNNFGFKFPSILFAIFAIYATYRLARLLYNDTVARMAALVLATCQGMFLMTNDVRCDTILMTCVISAIWLIQEWLMNKKLKYLLAASVAIGIGLMTKGPVALMVPVFCFATDWALKRQWRNFFQPAYLLGLVVIGILLIPMCIGLYQQFDMHPEKVVNGKSHVSGLRFFFWSQSFGRITGENPWKNNVDLGFLFQNMLWSYLPWIVVFIPAFLSSFIIPFRQKLRLQPGQEWLCTGGFLLTYLVLGSSSYQLPHYIFIVYPLASIIVARFLYDMICENKYPILSRIFRPFHWGLSLLLLLVTLFLMSFSFSASVFYIVAWVATFSIWLYFALNSRFTGKIFWLPAIAMVIANIYLTNQVYFTLLHYQAGSQAGRYIRSNNIPLDDVVIYKPNDPLNAIDFYAQGIVGTVDSLTPALQGKYMVTTDSGIYLLKSKGIAYQVRMQGLSFKVSELTPEFINPKTRPSATKNYYFLKLN